MPGARALFESVSMDVLFSLRSLRKRPLFTVVAVGTLGLGIGSATAMFSVIDGVLLRELPYDVRTDYGEPQAFDAHLAALKGSVEAFPDEADPLILLGYVSYYTGQRADAHRALRQAGDRLPKDELVAMLLKATQPSRFVARKPAD